MVFIFLSCHEKALVEKEFLRENSKRSCESQITTQTLKFILSDKLSAQYFVCALFFMSYSLCMCNCFVSIHV